MKTKHAISTLVLFLLQFALAHADAADGGEQRLMEYQKSVGSEKDWKALATKTITKRAKSDGGAKQEPSH